MCLSTDVIANAGFSQIFHGINVLNIFIYLILHKYQQLEEHLFIFCLQMSYIFLIFLKTKNRNKMVLPISFGLVSSENILGNLK